MGDYAIGLVGLAVMGQNLVLNMERNGFSVAVYNRTAERTHEFLAGEAKASASRLVRRWRSWSSRWTSPRKIMLMVQAGEPWMRSSSNCCRCSTRAT